MPRTRRTWIFALDITYDHNIIHEITVCVWNLHHLVVGKIPHEPLFRTSSTTQDSTQKRFIDYGGVPVSLTTMNWFMTEKYKHTSKCSLLARAAWHITSSRMYTKKGQAVLNPVVKHMRDGGTFQRRADGCNWWESTHKLCTCADLLHTTEFIALEHFQLIKELKYCHHPISTTGCLVTTYQLVQPPLPACGPLPPQQKHAKQLNKVN